MIVIKPSHQHVPPRIVSHKALYIHEQKLRMSIPSIISYHGRLRRGVCYMLYAHQRHRRLLSNRYMVLENLRHTRFSLTAHIHHNTITFAAARSSVSAADDAAKSITHRRCHRAQRALECFAYMHVVLQRKPQHFTRTH